MNFLKKWLQRSRTENTAKVAKERLQIIVSHERRTRTGPDFLPLLEKELIEVISKYISIQKDQVKVILERDGNCSILELNVTLPQVIEEKQKAETEIAD